MQPSQRQLDLQVVMQVLCIDTLTVLIRCGGGWGCQPSSLECNKPENHRHINRSLIGRWACLIYIQQRKSSVWPQFSWLLKHSLSHPQFTREGKKKVKQPLQEEEREGNLKKKVQLFRLLASYTCLTTELLQKEFHRWITMTWIGGTFSGAASPGLVQALPLMAGITEA